MCRFFAISARVCSLLSGSLFRKSLLVSYLMSRRFRDMWCTQTTRVVTKERYFSDRETRHNTSRLSVLIKTFRRRINLPMKTSSTASYMCLFTNRQLQKSVYSRLLAVSARSSTGKIWRDIALDCRRYLDPISISHTAT